MFLRPGNWSRSRRGATNNKLLVIGMANGSQVPGPTPPTRIASKSKTPSSKAFGQGFYNLNLD